MDRDEELDAIQYQIEREMDEERKNALLSSPKFRNQMMRMGMSVATDMDKTNKLADGDEQSDAPQKFIKEMFQQVSAAHQESLMYTPKNDIRQVPYYDSLGNVYPSQGPMVAPVAPQDYERYKNGPTQIPTNQNQQLPQMKKKPKSAMSYIGEEEEEPAPSLPVGSIEHIVATLVTDTNEKLETMCQILGEQYKLIKRILHLILSNMERNIEKSEIANAYLRTLCEQIPSECDDVEEYNEEGSLFDGSTDKEDCLDDESTDEPQQALEDEKTSDAKIVETEEVTPKTRKKREQSV